MISELKSRLFKLLREDEEFRYAVAGLLGLDEALKAIRILQEQVADNTEAIRVLQKQVADNTEAIRVLQRQVADNTEAIRALQGQVVEHSRILGEHSKRIEELARAVQALGARWGILAEDSFRRGMKELVESYFGGKVERWIHHDREGFVHGHPSIVEVDLVARDEERILIEVKSSVSKADVSELWRAGQLYERVEGVKPRLFVVSPYVDEKARETAEKLGIKVCTSL
ncbi:MAG: DUF3782 domain-containing protein [Candidatus Bathyarchaeia archaeon]